MSVILPKVKRLKYDSAAIRAAAIRAARLTPFDLALFEEKKRNSRLPLADRLDAAALRERAASVVAARSTPPTDRGVEMTDAVSLSVTGDPEHPDFIGSHPVSFHLDYLSVTVHGVDFERVSRLASQLINICAFGIVGELKRQNWRSWVDVSHEQGNGARGYRRLFRLPGGINLYCIPVSGSSDHAHFEIKGELATAMGAGRFRALFRYLDAMFGGSWRATRLDLAWDHVPFTPLDVLAAVMSGDVRTRARRDSLKTHEAPLSADEGLTTSLGSRQSTALMRVYDKRGPVRCELQLNKERAAAVCRVLAEREFAEWSCYGLGVLRDFVDFVDSESSLNRSRQALLGWWAEFLGGAERAGLRLSAREVKPLEAVRHWVRKQVSASLAVLCAVDLECAGGDVAVLLSLLDEGRSRYRKRHRALLSQAGLEVLNG